MKKEDVILIADDDDKKHVELIRKHPAQ